MAQLLSKWNIYESDFNQLNIIPIYITIGTEESINRKVINIKPIKLDKICYSKINN